MTLLFNNARTPQLLKIDRDLIPEMDLFTRSFIDYPLYTYIFPERSLRSSMLPLLYMISAECIAEFAYGIKVDGKIVAVLLIDSPYRRSPGWRNLLKIALRYSWRFPLRQGLKMLRIFNEFEEQRPAKPHWYVQLVAVDPLCQGQGLGGQCLDFMRNLSQDDPIYLETCGPGNVPFYLRNGYLQTQQFKCDKGKGPDTWCFISD